MDPYIVALSCPSTRSQVDSVGFNPRGYIGSNFKGDWLTTWPWMATLDGMLASAEQLSPTSAAAGSASIDEGIAAFFANATALFEPESPGQEVPVLTTEQVLQCSSSWSGHVNSSSLWSIQMPQAALEFQVGIMSPFSSSYEEQLRVVTRQRECNSLAVRHWTALIEAGTPPAGAAEQASKYVQSLYDGDKCL